MFRPRPGFSRAFANAFFPTDPLRPLVATVSSRATREPFVWHAASTSGAGEYEKTRAVTSSRKMYIDFPGRYALRSSIPLMAVQPRFSTVRC